jgi:hypothetical protein
MCNNLYYKIEFIYFIIIIFIKIMQKDKVSKEEIIAILDKMSIEDKELLGFSSQPKSFLLDGFLSSFKKNLIEVDNKVLNDKVLDNKVLNDKVLDDKVLDDKVLNNEVLNDEVLDNKVLDNKVLNDEISNDEK